MTVKTAYHVCVCVCVGVVIWPACLSDGQYQCDSGQCISVDVVCDGRAHCRDQSDQLSCRMFFSHSLSPGGASLSLAVRRQSLLCTSSRVNRMGSCCMALSSSIHSQSSGKHFELQPSEWDPGLCPVVFRVFLISQMSSLLPLCKYYSFFNYSTQVLPNPRDLWKMFPVKNS